jgi:transcription initiation factor TFIIF subunit alpha
VTVVRTRISTGTRVSLLIIFSKLLETSTKTSSSKYKMSGKTNIITVKCKFASEDDNKLILIKVPEPCTVKIIREKFLQLREDVKVLISKKGGTFEGFECCVLPSSIATNTRNTDKNKVDLNKDTDLVDTVTTMMTTTNDSNDNEEREKIGGLSISDASTPLEDSFVFENDCELVTMALTKEYALKALNPVRKYTVGLFHGTNLPKFKSGKQAAVEWQMRRTIDEATLQPSGLSLVGGKRQAFVGAKEKGQSAKFYILKSQNVNDFCALPMETWYNFRQLMSRKVLNLEEAEELMKSKQDRLYETSAKFVGSGAANADLERFSDSEDDFVNKKNRDDDSDDDEDEDGQTKKRGRKRGGGKKKAKDEEETKEKNEDGIGEGWEHDQTYSDDEGGEVAAAIDPEQQEIDKQNAPKPPTADSDDELDENAQKIKTLVERQNAIENNATAAALFSDDEDDDDDDIPEDFDPDNEKEVNVVGRLFQTVKEKEEKEKEAAVAAAKAEAAEEQHRPSPAIAQQQQQQQQQGVKRSASQAGISSQENSARKSTQRPLSRGVSAPVLDKIKDESATNPIEKIIRDLLKQNPGRTTMKDITKACRKAGLVSSDAGKTQLKQTIERILRFTKTSDGVMVVLLK